MNHTTKIALVTGGSRGLGKNAALALAGKGIGVVITYHTQQAAADEVVREIEQAGGTAAAIQLDTSVVSSFDGFAASLGDVLKTKWDRDSFDFLINNAGIGKNVPFPSMTEEVFDTLMNIHFKGVYFLTQKLLPLLADNGGIVNVSTGLARFAMEGYSAYASMKGAIEVLTRYLAKELGKRGIRVNAVAPGAIETDFGGGTLRDNPQVNSHIASITALGRAGVPDDIGGVIAALCTDDMRWVNAQRIEASGGMLL
ncbi:NAD(P)-dependent dehydrogenase (short-subunit alcohol dehydrogenase family) [Paenibacillus taihuensis]|uniref:NAD(P)-dependent dehydrogenase (Short-subunit alcohol dehydrogenase family) n=1 Tax=Paenibacillus taihuensis TaxID=1156355 RepID=A0A3D9RSS2_9BACL|nr:SDR family oxidoreductase [Paenibacillus taihuensis]REE80186.1 NAD(P)-dependent dehydrogenase (short-subunit alcohol dehydrogenase family) [Paenibacillus taihuensis]